jgi:acyl carrier protein
LETIQKLEALFKEVFLEVPTLANETTADDIEEWDSLTNVALIVMIEEQFNIRFSTGEVETYKNVGDLCAAIDEKSSSA